MTVSTHPEQAVRRSAEDPRRDWPRVVRAQISIVLSDDDPKRKVFETQIERLKEALGTAIEVTMRDLGHAVKGISIDMTYGTSAIHTVSRTGAYVAVPPVISA